MYWIVAFLRLLHFLVLLFIVGAWFYPSPLVWKVHLVAVPIIVVQWHLNQDRCIFTNIEVWLRKVSGLPPMDAAEPSVFIKSVLRICLSPLPNDKQVLWITYGSMIVSCSLSAYQLNF